MVVVVEHVKGARIDVVSIMETRLGAARRDAMTGVERTVITTGDVVRTVIMADLTGGQSKPQSLVQARYLSVP